VENVATTPGSILGAVDLFGYVRETNYGQIFDVRVEPDPANLAFTSLGIGMHTDNPYRDPVPGLQLLHCLVNESDGANQLCGGFAVGAKIRRGHPEAFDLLTHCPVRFRFVESGSADLESYVPLIELDARGEIVGIRYNSRSGQPFDMDASVLADYYDAYRVLGEAHVDAIKTVAQAITHNDYESVVPPWPASCTSKTSVPNQVSNWSRPSWVPPWQTVPCNRGGDSPTVD
jgi:alpha-ketoglutarate-dependent taurine dioxygenase